MCQIALSKSTEKVLIKKKNRSCVIFLWTSWVIFLTTVHTVTAVTTVTNMFFYYSCKEQFDRFDNRCDVLRSAFCNSHNVLVITVTTVTTATTVTTVTTVT